MTLHLNTRTRITRLGAISAVVVAATIPAVVARPDAVGAAGAAPVVAELRVDDVVDAVGVGAAPRFSWVVEDADRGERVTAYELSLAARESDLGSSVSTWRRSWSETSDAASPTGTSYDGPALASSTRYWIALRVRDAGGTWSVPRVSTFVTGVVAESDWSASWIEREAGATRPHGRFRHEFALPGRAVEAAWLHLGARGLVEATINGADVDGSDTIDGDEVANPAWTDWDQRVLVRTFDVTDLLVTGANAIGLEATNGWYRSSYYGHATPGEPVEETPPAQVLAQLVVRFADGTTRTVGTGPGWSAADGPVQLEVPLLGEHVDLRTAVAQDGWDRPSGAGASAWSPATIAAPQPAVAREATVLPPVRVVSSRPPASGSSSTVVVGDGCAETPVSPLCPTAPPACRAFNVAALRPGDEVTVIDLGAVVTGFVSVGGVAGDDGATVEVAYGQTLGAHGRVDELGTGTFWGLSSDNGCQPGIPPDAHRHQIDRFVLSGGASHVLAPRFSYKSFRYVEIRGLGGIDPASVQVHEVRDASAVRGSFRSSDPLLDQVWDAAVRTYGNNMHGYLEDNVVRERRGWAADAHLNAEAILYTYDSAPMWRKWLGDIRTTQRAFEAYSGLAGRSAYVHPGRFFGLGSLDPIWSAALPFVAWRTYLHTGDRSVLELAWGDGGGVPALADWFIDEARSSSENPTSRPDDPLLMDVVPFTYGDHIAREPSSITLTATGYYVAVLETAIAIADELGRSSTSEPWRAELAAVRERFEEVFWDASSASYRGRNPDQRYGPDGLAPTVPTAMTSQAIAPAIGVNGLGTALDLHVGGAACATCARGAQALVTQVAGGLVTAGLVGTHATYRALVKLGAADAAYTSMTDPRNFVAMASQTGTIWETWPDGLFPASARDQPGLAAGAVEWLVSGLGGIRPRHDGPGFRQVDIHPQVPATLDHAAVQLGTVRGELASGWRKDGADLEVEVTIPVGSTANVRIPLVTDAAGAVVLLDGRVLHAPGAPSTGAPGVVVEGVADEALVLEVGSGTYVFRSTDADAVPTTTTTTTAVPATTTTAVPATTTTAVPATTTTAVPATTTTAVPATTTTAVPATTTTAPRSPGRPVAGAAAFVVASPTRLLDTREPAAPVPTAGTRTTIAVRGRAGVPTDATAVAVQVAAAEGVGTGWVAVTPTGSTPGTSANLNVDVAGEEIANLAVVPIGADGSIEVVAHAPTHVIVDLVGWWAPVDGAVAAGRFTSGAAPRRLVDTRVDAGVARARDGSTTTIQVTGRAGVPARGVAAVVVNLAVTDTDGPGFVQAGGAAGFRPGRTSTLNVDAAGETASTAAIVPVDADGRISIYTQRGAHLVLDVTGWFTDAEAPPGIDGLFVPNERVQRVIDTRAGGAIVPAGGELTLTLPGTGVVGNIAVTDPVAPGWVQLGPSAPFHVGATANINTPGPGGVLSNAFVVPVDGVLRAHTYSATHIVIDVAGRMT